MVGDLNTVIASTTLSELAAAFLDTTLFKSCAHVHVSHVHTCPIHLVSSTSTGEVAKAAGSGVHVSENSASPLTVGGL